METSSELTGEQLSLWMSSAADTHANHSATLEGDAEQTTQGIYGPGYGTPLASYDPDTQSWKMCGDISLWEEPQCLASLPKSGMTRNGVLYQRLAWVPLIDATGLSLLHTPTAKANQMSPSMRAQSRWWPTPTAHGENTATRNEAHARRLANGMKYSSRLTQAVAQEEPESIGYLNPLWVEWLMGFPTGWTDLEV
jgi:hypothetical protein